MTQETPDVLQERIVTLSGDGRRADVALSEASGLTRSRIATLMAQGQVTIDGKTETKPGAKAKPGQTLVLTIPAPAPAAPVAQDIPLTILYQDEDLAVVLKPCGMVVHPAAGNEDGTLVNALLHHCGDSLSGINGEKRPGIVHRIDMDTTGLLIVAKNDMAHQALAAQLQDHSLCRTYECIVHGGFAHDAGTIDAPIGRCPTDRKKMAVTEKNSRPAVTHWEVIARYGRYTHLRCRLETGRTHQIRVHMAYLNHPIAGDPLYGAKKPELGLSSQCLHACALTFLHPRTGERMTLTCPLPEEFTHALALLQSRS